ncbi:MAG: nitronate monooxygenase family protein [Candidatus Cloacimonetes bacterium]|nr:nitronate monooxygenase family protein [Candidatus Cloacimonadota bacterium]
MNIPQLTIGKTVCKIPIIQGGMGVRVSLAGLASAVANEGGVGTISSIGLGDLEASKNDYERLSKEALIREINKAREITDGHLAVNIMGVLSNADDLVRTVAKENVNTLVFGAGLPTKLPLLVEDSEINLVPIISSARVAELILRSWRKYDRIVDAFILEGPLAGGHLGFSESQLEESDKYSLEILLPQVLEVIKPYEDKFGKKIPVIAAGGIYTGKDIARMLSLGASGVQMATRFVCTNECDVSEEFKQAYINAGEDDIVIIKSPVGMPGRAIRNNFIKKIEVLEKVSFRCNYRCLTACQVEKAKFCIADALVNAYYGNLDKGLIFCGRNAYRLDKIVSVKELINELITELSEA